MPSPTPPAVALALRSYSGQVELHDHDVHQIVLALRGSMEIEVEGRGGRVDASQGVVLPAGARHAFQTKTTNTFMVLDIGQAQASADAPRQRLGEQRFFALTPQIRHLLDYAAHSAHPLIDAPLLVDAWSRLLLSSIEPPRKPDAHRGELCLARALNHIEQHLGSRLTAAGIARAAGLSERALYRLFEQQMQCSPFAHIATLRLNKAFDLLRESSLPIASIAQQVGYADQSALTHAMKNTTRLTPAAVRKHHATRQA